MHTTHLLLILVGLALVCYVPFLGNKLVWDDEQFIYSNAYVQNFSVAKIFTTNTVAGAGVVSNYYRPLTTLSFAIDYQFWGRSPIGYHLPNLLLHLAAGLLLFYLLQLIRLPRTASFWLSVLFIVHPIQTEAVVYANSRGDSLYTVFTLLSLISFLYFYQQKQLVLHFYEQKLVIKSIVFAGASLIFYLFSILSKEIGIAVFGLHGLLFVQQALTNHTKLSLRKSLWVTKIALGLLTALVLTAIGYLWLRGTALNFDNSYNFYDATSLYGQRLDVRLLTFSKVIWIYLQLLLFPYPLHMERTTELVATWRSIFPWITIGGIMVLAWLGWREYRLKKQVWIWLGTGWFFGMLLPGSGIIPINGLLYEHWLYLPMVGFFLCLYGLSYTAGIVKIAKQPAQILLSLAIFALLLLTQRQNYIWSTPIRFYTYLLNYSESPRIQNNLAMAYAEAGEYEQALLHYQRSLELSHSYPQTYYNMANLYLATDQYAAAIPLLQQAVALAPDFGLAQQKLDVLLTASASGTLHFK